MTERGDRNAPFSAEVQSFLGLMQEPFLRYILWYTLRITQHDRSHVYGQ